MQHRPLPSSFPMPGLPGSAGSERPAPRECRYADRLRISACAADVAGQRKQREHGGSAARNLFHCKTEGRGPERSYRESAQGAARQA